MAIRCAARSTNFFSSLFFVPPSLLLLIFFLLPSSFLSVFFILLLVRREKFFAENLSQFSFMFRVFTRFCRHVAGAGLFVFDQDLVLCFFCGCFSCLFWEKNIEKLVSHAWRRQMYNLKHEISTLEISIFHAAYSFDTHFKKGCFLRLFRANNLILWYGWRVRKKRQSRYFHGLIIAYFHLLFLKTKKTPMEGDI